MERPCGRCRTIIPGRREHGLLGSVWELCWNSAAFVAVLDRKQVVTNQVRQVITYSYDALGRKSQVTPPSMSGSIHDVPTTYQYDPAGRLTGVINTVGSTFTYDAADRRVTEGVGPLVTTKTYDAADRITALATTVPGASVTMTNFSYRYDNVGNRLGLSKSTVPC